MRSPLSWVTGLVEAAVVVGQDIAEAEVVTVEVGERIAVGVLVRVDVIAPLEEINPISRQAAVGASPGAKITLVALASEEAREVESEAVSLAEVLTEVEVPTTAGLDQVTTMAGAIHRRAGVRHRGVITLKTRAPLMMKAGIDISVMWPNLVIVHDPLLL